MKNCLSERRGKQQSDKYLIIELCPYINRLSNNYRYTTGLLAVCINIEQSILEHYFISLDNVVDYKRKNVNNVTRSWSIVKYLNVS